jgi:hypothetical protein
MLPVPSKAELSGFSGRPVATYGSFADAALEQATLMFTVRTKLTAYPDDPDQAKLARFAILELADRLFLEQPYAEYTASPFQSESIMSYNYSRATQTSLKVQQGLKTGLFWWDLAIDELAQPGTSVLAHGSVEPVPDGLYRQDDGDPWRIINPAQSSGTDQPPYIRIS